MLYGITREATAFTDAFMSNWRIRLLKAMLFFVPRADPDHERLYPLVKAWALELDDAGWPQREVALDAAGSPIFAAPDARNTGFWPDMARCQFSQTDLEPLTEEASMRSGPPAKSAPNNVFKPNSCRSTNNAAENAFHALCSAEQTFSTRASHLMTDPHDQPEDLDATVASELERLKRLPPALLHALGSGLTRVKMVGDRSYELKAWSQPVTGKPGSFAILVGVLEPGSSSPTHLGGFLATAGEPYTDLSRETLEGHYEP